MSKTVLAIVAHADDETLGCGGTLKKHATQGDQVHIAILADGETARAKSIHDIALFSEKIAIRAQQAQQAGKLLGASSVSTDTLPDNRLDSLTRLDIVKKIESIIETIQPDVVFTHHAGDVNIDHQIIHHAVVTATRPIPGNKLSTLLFFETLSSTEWMPPHSAPSFTPNWFCDITKTLADKLNALAVYNAEIPQAPHPRAPESVTALAHYRGASVGFEAAEAFMLGRHRA